MQLVLYRASLVAAFRIGQRLLGRQYIRHISPSHCLFDVVTIQETSLVSSSPPLKRQVFHDYHRERINKREKLVFESGFQSPTFDDPCRNKDTHSMLAHPFFKKQACHMGTQVLFETNTTFSRSTSQNSSLRKNVFDTFFRDLLFITPKKQITLFRGFTSLQKITPSF